MTCRLNQFGTMLDTTSQTMTAAAPEATLTVEAVATVTNGDDGRIFFECFTPLMTHVTYSSDKLIVIQVSALHDLSTA